MPLASNCMCTRVIGCVIVQVLPMCIKSFSQEAASSGSPRISRFLLSSIFLSCFSHQQLNWGEKWTETQKQRKNTQLFFLLHLTTMYLSFLFVFFFCYFFFSVSPTIVFEAFRPQDKVWLFLLSKEMHLLQKHRLLANANLVYTTFL